MFIYTVGIFFLLTIIGNICVIHMKQNTYARVYAPWAGMLLIAQIGFVLSLSKIPFKQSLLGVSIFNATYIIILTIVGLAGFSFFFFKNNIQKRNNNKLALFIVCYVFIFFLCIPALVRTGDIQIAQRAEELKISPLTTEMFLSKGMQEKRWSIGIPILVAFFSEIFHVSTLDASNALHVMCIPLAILLMMGIVVKILRLQHMKVLGIVFLILTILPFIFIQYMTLQNILLLGTILFSIHLTLDYIKFLKEHKNTSWMFLCGEELLLAQIFLFLAMISSLTFKIILCSFILMMFTVFFRRKQTSFLWLKVLLLTIVMNPFLIGLALEL